GLPIAIEIASPDDLPTGHAGGPNPVRTHQHISLRPTHVPDSHLARGVVLPHKVGLSVAVEIAYCDDAPTRDIRRSERIGSQRVRALGTTQINDHQLTGRLVLRDDVEFAVAVKVV